MRILSAILILVLSFGQIQTQEEAKHKPRAFKENVTDWSLSLMFSDNGFGFGGSKYFQLSKNTSLFAGLLFGSAKDSREFEQSDIYGQSVVPYKQNRLFLIPVVNLGMQLRLFREEVTDNMRPLINFGVSPTAIVYTPYDRSFFSSFNYARVKFAFGGFVGAGVDYLTSKTTSLSFNFRYYYISLFGEGIKSLSVNEKKQFGGVYFLFSYNFMKRK